MATAAQQQGHQGHDAQTQQAQRYTRFSAVSGAIVAILARGQALDDLERLQLFLDHLRILTTMTSPSAAPVSVNLSDAEYTRLAHGLLASVEQTLDRWLDEDVVDIDSHRTGGLLELSFPGGSKIILNTQPPLHEIWMAARAGGYHYRWNGAAWVDTRSGEEFCVALSRQASAQAGQALVFTAPVY